jgi:hypothetical protein
LAVAQPTRTQGGLCAGASPIHGPGQCLPGTAHPGQVLGLTHLAFSRFVFSFLFFFVFYLFSVFCLIFFSFRFIFFLCLN